MLSIPRMRMPYFPTMPGHQKQCYQPRRENDSMHFAMRDFSHLLQSQRWKWMEQWNTLCMIPKNEFNTTRVNSHLIPRYTLICWASEQHWQHTAIGGLEDGNTKPLYRYIKQLRMENLCLPPLKAGGSLITSACDKAATLLAEFSSVFTIEDLSFIPWLGPAKHKIQDI